MEIRFIMERKSIIVVEKKIKTTTEKIEKSRKEIKNLLLRNLLRTNTKLMKNIDMSNVVLF